MLSTSLLRYKDVNVLHNAEHTTRYNTATKPFLKHDSPLPGINDFLQLGTTCLTTRSYPSYPHGTKCLRTAFPPTSEKHSQQRKTQTTLDLLIITFILIHTIIIRQTYPQILTFIQDLTTNPVG